MSTLHISKEFADLLKRYGEERLLNIVRVWDNRNKWQRERYHRKLKPLAEELRRQREATEARARGETHSPGTVEVDIR